MKTASHALVPKGPACAPVAADSAPRRRLYLKGLEVESHGEFRTGVYQEFARGFGVARLPGMLIRTGKANQTRLKTASEFENRRAGGLRLRTEPRSPRPLRCHARGAERQ